MLYDFEGDAENGELNITEGAMITVLNQVCMYQGVTFTCNHIQACLLYVIIFGKGTSSTDKSVLVDWWFHTCYEYLYTCIN